MPDGQGRYRSLRLTRTNPTPITKQSQAVGEAIPSTRCDRLHTCDGGGIGPYATQVHTTKKAEAFSTQVSSLRADLTFACLSPPRFRPTDHCAGQVRLILRVTCCFFHALFIASGYLLQRAIPQDGKPPRHRENSPRQMLRATRFVNSRCAVEKRFYVLGHGLNGGF